MKIQLDQNEIETAVKNYINEKVNIKEGQEIELDFTAGRGERGLTVDVNIGPITKSATAPTTVTKVAEPAAEVAAPKTERVNGKTVVASSVGKPTPAAEDEVASAGDDAGLDEAAPATEEEAPVRAGGSIFGGM